MDKQHNFIKGMRVQVKTGGKRTGVVTSDYQTFVRVRLDGAKQSESYHSDLVEVIHENAGVKEEDLVQAWEDLGK